LYSRDHLRAVENVPNVRKIAIPSAAISAELTCCLSASLSDQEDEAIEDRQPDQADRIQRFFPQCRLFSLRNKLPKPLRQPFSATSIKVLCAVAIFISFDNI
jgi:hypothetical protein